MNFKIGDRVRVVKISRRKKYFSYSSSFNTNNSGITGTVIVDTDTSALACFTDEYTVGIKFDKRVAGGHDLNGRVLNGYGQYVLCEDLELVEDYKRDIKQIYQELKRPYKNEQI